MPSPGFFYAFIVPEILAAAYVYGVVVGKCFVSSEEAKYRRFGTSIDDGQQIVEKDTVRVVVVSPRRVADFPHPVMDETSRRDTQPEELVEDVEPTVPFLRPAAGRELQCTVCGPLEGRIVRHYKIEVAVKAYFTCFHLVYRYWFYMRIIVARRIFTHTRYIITT